MNSSRANVAQYNVRKSLRIRRACVVPKKAMNFRAKEGKIKKAKSIVRSPTKASEFASVATIVGNENDHHLAKSSIGLKKRPVGLKLNNNLIGADQSGETVEGTESVAPAISHSNQEFKKVQLENLGSGDSDLCEILSTVTNEEDNVDRSETLDSSSEIDGSVEVISDEDDKISEHSDIDCVESVLKGLNKDIGQLYSKSDKIEKDVKELKKLLLARQSRTCIRAVSSRLKLQLAFHLLPKFPLQKKSLVRKVDREFEGEDDENDNEEYKEQLIKKLASFGGSTINEMVINIFKKMFSLKLKTKYCWTGSKRGRGKSAFRRLTGIRDAIWYAVQVHFPDCTESRINKEIKLRLNQAQKDYDREMARQRQNNDSS